MRELILCFEEDLRPRPGFRCPESWVAASILQLLTWLAAHSAFRTPHSALFLIDLRHTAGTLAG
ncbi:hypothetical protein [Microbulbifer magnicolonia]|uniref:hypothetical protein n=1 Tax=Microbulbifer magnicolonia TaxID=3109744 RepID=UPI002B413566|nr:hypothetical protein [Microbulbifer sp. GG15]